MDSKTEYNSTVDLSSIMYDIKHKESQIHSVREHIECLKNEVETLKMEGAWCYDSRGNRTIPTAEEQAAEISRKLTKFPHLVEDTVKALRQKKIDLQSDLRELQQKSEELDLLS